MIRDVLYRCFIILAVSGITASLPTVVYSQTFASGSLDVSGEDVDGNYNENSTTDGLVMETTTTVNDNGNISKSTEVTGVTGNADMSNFGSGSSSSDNSSASAGNGGTASDKIEVKETKKEDDSKYDGLFNGRHIIPDIMAMHCHVMGEDIAKDPNLLIDCIKQYVSEANNSNAGAKMEAHKEFEILRYNVLQDLSATAITKSAAIAVYEPLMNKYNEATLNANTAHDDVIALVQTLAVMTDVFNDIRELQVEQMKYQAISAIYDIDPSIIADVGDSEDKEQDVPKASSSSGGNEYFGVGSQAEIK